ncbi:MAG: dihydropteroate synthase [Gammaproteobacteria bacterium]|nr:dihydropteroate synthase [Gammaproteobacteria bacterium]
MRVILGLGSNLNFPMRRLRQALAHLRAHPHLTVIKTSSLYLSEAQLPENAPLEWNRPYLNLAVLCEADLTPGPLLSALQRIEIEMGRNPSHERWAPRVIDIDILTYGEESADTPTLSLPHSELFHRPFALLPLLEIAPDWTHPKLKEIPWAHGLCPPPFQTQKLKHQLDAPALMGIVNVTPDSFSDGGLYQNPESVLAHIQSLVEAGAEIIDIGAESTRPKATLLSTKEEWERLEPILEALANLSLSPALMPEISLDTRHAEIAQRALTRSAVIQWINDVSGEEAHLMAAHLAGSDIRYVLMHHKGVPPQETLAAGADPISTLLEWGEKRIHDLTKLGFDPSQLIFDVGLGFGLTPAQNWQVIQHAYRFKSLGLPVLFGHSRKSFMRQEEPETGKRDPITALISHHLADQKIDYLRVHNVLLTNQFFRIRNYLTEEMHYARFE